MVEAVGGQIDDPLGGREDFNPFLESAGHTHHIGNHLKHDRRLLSVSGATMHLRALLAVTARSAARQWRRPAQGDCVCKHERPTKYRWDGLLIWMHCIRFQIG